MPALTAQQLDERIALYRAYRDAVAKLDGLISSLPEECPKDLRVGWGDVNVEPTTTEEVAYAPRQRTRFIVQRAWPSLRKAVIADAEKELADAEAAVLAFERGDEVTPTAGAVPNASE